MISQKKIQTRLSRPLKIEEIRRKRKKIFYIKISLFFTLIIGFFIGLSYLSKIEALRIKEISFVGNEVITSDELGFITNPILDKKYIYLFPKNNILLYPQKKIENAILKNFNRINTVKAKVKNNILTIKITERVGVFLFCENNQEIQEEENLDQEVDQENCYLADTSGFIFDKAPIFSGQTYFKFINKIENKKIIIGEKFLSDFELNNLITFKNSLVSYNLPVSTLTLNKEIHEFQIENSGKIIFNKNSDLDKISKGLGSALKSESFLSDFNEKIKNLDYFDLRFDDKIYFKLKS